ncbi:MAG: 2-hydroxyacyl-CoA dehydratase [Spirochaetota bacterium]
MSGKQIRDIIEVLDSRLELADVIIAAYKEKTGNVVAGSLCETIPPEIALSAGISLLSIPEKYQVRLLDEASLSADTVSWLTGCYDVVIIPSCFKKLHQRLIDAGMDAYTFHVPSGWGEESSVALHNEIMRLFSETGITFDPLSETEKIQDACRQYDSLRKIIRGIAAARVDNADKLSNRDLQVVFESAICLPLESVMVELSLLLELLPSKYPDASDMWNVMIFGGKKLNWDLLDAMELQGQLVVVEDDVCCGRRKFDISLNSKSENIYYELLDMYSYKPYCPELRPVEERYELLYKLLKNYSIDLVVLMDEQICEERDIHAEYLYHRLRQDGIDTILCDEDNILDVTREYTQKYTRGVRISISTPLEDE